MLPTLAAILIFTTLIQLAALRRMGRRRPIGDEVSYLARGLAEDPQTPRLFLRPPLLPWLAALCVGGPGGDAGLGERRLRWLMAGASVSTVALTALAGWAFGPEVALLGALLLAAQPERILIGCHIWPDTLLGLVLATLTLFLASTTAPAWVWVAGGIAALGVLIRIDFLAVLPLFWAAWVDSYASPAAVTAAALIGPSLVALIILSVRNHRRYGIPLPDTSWAFNLMVARSEARRRDVGRLTIEETIEDAAATWKQLSPREVLRPGLAAFAEVLRSPGRLLLGMFRRLLTAIGPDTFIRQKLLPVTAAYPDLDGGARRWWGVSLRLGFPLLVTLLLAASVGSGSPGSYAWPSLGLLAVAVLFHARTRYRVAILPTLSLAAAQGMMELPSALGGHSLALAGLLAGGALFLWVLLRIRCSAELP